MYRKKWLTEPKKNGGSSLLEKKAYLAKNNLETVVYRKKMAYLAIFFLEAVVSQKKLFT